MKKVLITLFALLLFVPATLFAEEKVKVYIFESGGCPYCEAEIEYLKGLDGYKKTFVIVKKELYVDHIDWKPGKDYDLGVEVANAFNDAGYEDASYTGTPFVVISDIYAAASYSEDLETYINLAHTEGDKDAVSCIAAGKDNCIRAIEKEIAGDISKSGEKAGVVVAILGGVALLGLVVYLLKTKQTVKDDIEEDEDFEEDEDEFEDEEEEIEEEVTESKNTPKRNNNKRQTNNRKNNGKRK